jgi:hypothetical protein
MGHSKDSSLYNKPKKDAYLLYNIREMVAIVESAMAALWVRIQISLKNSNLIRSLSANAAGWISLVHAYWQILYISSVSGEVWLINKVLD